MGKTVNLDILDRIGVASPCSADWDAMNGDERKRFCADCKLHVYNLSAMTREESVELITQSEGRLCIRLFRRADGTILTKDCPVGLRAVRLRAARAAGRVAAAIAFMITGGVMLGSGRHGAVPARLRQIRPFSVICEWISPSPPQVVGRMMAGEMCVLPTAPPPPGKGAGAQGQ